MSYDWSKLSEAMLAWLKLPGRTFFALATVCGILTFAPKSVTDVLELTDLLRSWRPYVAMAFLLFSVLLLATFVAWLGKWVRPRVHEYLTVRNLRKRLHALDDPERALLARFVAANTRSLLVSITDGTAMVLQNERILFQASKIGDFVDGFAFAIQPWAWEYLQQHQGLLEPELSQMKAKPPKPRHPYYS